jgi:hypothetical protein
MKAPAKICLEKQSLLIRMKQLLLNDTSLKVGSAYAKSWRSNCESTVQQRRDLSYRPIGPWHPAPAMYGILKSLNLTLEYVCTHKCTMAATLNQYRVLLGALWNMVASVNTASKRFLPAARGILLAEA